MLWKKEGTLVQVIPVIDLMNGIVVHARKGDRAHYAPIVSSLCNDSAAPEILAALLELYPFPLLYIADLDAIQKRGHHLDLVIKLLNQHPALQIWIDAGIQSVETLAPWRHSRLRPVLGTESIPDLAAWQQLRQSCINPPVLSLDFTVDGYQGPPEILYQAQHWPQDVIVMSLPHVGSNNGPDMERLNHFRTQYPSHHFYAAGGVRHQGDLQLLNRQGIQGALVASALHNGVLSQAELHALLDV